MSDVSGAIIAAGRGERLRSPQNPLPKPLVELGGQTLLCRQIRSLQAAGARKVYVVVNSETASIIEERKLALPGGSDVTVRDTPNSMESLLALGERLPQGWFIAATVDSIVEAGALQTFVSESQRLVSEQHLDGALAVVKWSGDRRPLFVEIDNGLISRVGAAQGEFVTAGIYWLQSSIFELAGRARHRRCEALRAFLALAVDSGRRFAAVKLKSALDIDEPADLERARAASNQK